MADAGFINPYQNPNKTEKVLSSSISLIHESTVLQVSSKNDVLTGIEHNLDILTVGRTGNVVVDDALFISVDCKEFFQEVLAAFLVVFLTPEFTSEVLVGFHSFNIDNQNFFLKQIPLVQEKDHGGVLKVAIVADFLEEAYGLVHPVGVGILK